MLCPDHGQILNLCGRHGLRAAPGEPRGSPGFPNTSPLSPIVGLNDDASLPLIAQYPGDGALVVAVVTEMLPNTPSV